MRNSIRDILTDCRTAGLKETNSETEEPRCPCTDELQEADLATQVPEMDEFEELAEIAISPGDLKAVVNAMESEEAIVMVCDGALSFMADTKIGNVAIKARRYPIDGLVDQTLGIIRMAELKPIVDQIPTDISIWEKRIPSLMNIVTRYETKVGKLDLYEKDPARWSEMEDKLWTEDPEYRRLSLELAEASSHVVRLNCFLFPDRMEFWLITNFSDDLVLRLSVEIRNPLSRAECSVAQSGVEVA